MPDWTNPNLPPDNPAGTPGAPPGLLNYDEWQQYLNRLKTDKTREFQNNGTLPRQQSVHGPWYSLDMHHEFSEESFYVDGAAPSPWEKVDSYKESPDGKTDFTMWTRTYPTLTIRTYTKVTIHFTKVKTSSNGRVERIPLPPPTVLWYVKETRTVNQARVYVWEESSKKNDSGQWIKVATPPVETVPPGMPPGGTKLGDPKDELRTAFAPLQIDEDGFHVAVALRVLAADTREPLANVVVEWDGEPVGQTPATGLLNIRRTLDRPREPLILRPKMDIG